MSSVGIGVAVGVGMGVGLACGALVTLLRRGERADVKRAHRFAREQDLWLPSELARVVGARVRRRSGLGMLTSALIGAPLFGWYFAVMFAHLDSPVSADRIPPFEGPMVFALSWGAPLGLINVAVQLRDATRDAWRSGELPAAGRLRPAALRQVVPPSLTWASRCLAVAGPAAAVVVCALHGHGAQALLFGGLTVAAGFAAQGVERLQLRVLNGGRLPASGPELAFDEAFRVSTLLSLVMTAPMLVALAGAACFETLHAAGTWVVPLYNGWIGLMVCAAIVLNAVVTGPGVRRYYRRRLPLSRVPESAPC